MSKAIEQAILAKNQATLAADQAFPAIKRAVMKQGINGATEDQAAQIAMDPVFSIDLITGEVANQKQSGRCWMFAALNTFRHKISADFKLKDFELSQNYTFFWDKYEKANWFYENVLRTANQATSSREVAWLMTTPQQDGGQWDMLVALIQKYGIVPKTVMPETFSSSKSNELNKMLNLKLRKDAVALRSLVSEGADEAKIAEIKETYLGEVYRILVATLGEPPVKFDFEYRDIDKVYHIEKQITPKAFFDKYVGMNLADYVSIINAPTTDKPYNHMYTVDMLGNVVGGPEVRHLNLEMDTFKDLAIKQLQSGESVWFGCDVGQFSEREHGIMDTALYPYNDTLGVDFTMSKAERLDYGESLMTHAMVLTGVDLVDEKPTKWKVENSWGDKVGTKGYFVASDAWMDEFTYQIVVNKQFLPENIKAVLNEEATVLAPWDPMGALA